MKIYRRFDTGHRASRFTLLSLFVLALAMLLAALPVAGKSNAGQDKDKKDSNRSVGFILSQDASAKDVGLPAYPGAQRSKDTSDDSSALQMGLWGGDSGFKLVVLKLDSSDSPEKVAAFYRKALARYGTVLDCGKSVSKHQKAAGQSNSLDCESDQPVNGGFTLKAGTKEKQHVVAVEPNGSLTRISLVYVEAPGSASKGD
jgi:hypothetical protein